MHELELERRASTARRFAPAEAAKNQQLESLRLARAEMQRQQLLTSHTTRRAQIEAALAEIDRRIALVAAPTVSAA
ncbi:MAG: hypothetical protein HYZ58_03755 [Acidobacteria bacterium]|nr:hypothetical protein [Acidobacteriota bacterium]